MNFNLFHILPSIGIQSLCWSMCNVMILFVQHRQLMTDQEICWKMFGLCTKYHYGQLYCQWWPSDDIGYLKTDWTN